MSHSILKTLALCLILNYSIIVQAQTKNRDELRKRIDEIQSQIDALRKQQERQKSELQILRKNEEAVITEPQEEPPAEKTRDISSGAERTTFNRNQEAVARINNQPLDSTLPGFFNIPGTRARVKFDGYVKFDVNIDPRPAGNPDQFTVTTIPIIPPGGAEPSNVEIIARQTRYIVDFRSPTRRGDLRVYLEGDFYGADGTNDPHMRHYYGQVGNILIGQTSTLFTDPDVNPDVLDKQGPSGLITTRRAQLRWTQTLKDFHSFAVSVEKPLLETRQFTPDGSVVTPAPDVVVSWRYEKKRGHTQVNSLFRAIGYDFGDHDETVFGWGLSGSMGVKVFHKDQLQLFGSYGAGYASLIKNLNNLDYGGYDLEYNNSGSKLEALPAMGAYFAYQRQWKPSLRSTATFGFDRVQNTVPQPANAFSKSYYTSGNLIWNPVGNLNIGAEFLHGWQVLKDNSKASANRIQFSIKYDLYRKKDID